MGDNENHKRTTKINPYKGCVEDLVFKDLPMNIAYKIEDALYNHWPAKRLLSLATTIFFADTFCSKCYFNEFNEDMYSRELYECFLKKEYGVILNDGIDENSLKNNEDEQVDLWTRKRLARKSIKYSAVSDDRFVSDLIKYNIPFYSFFIFDFSEFITRELIKVKVIKEIVRYTSKSFYKTIVKVKCKNKIEVSFTDIFKKIIDAIYYSNLSKNEDWWIRDIEFEAVYLLFSIEPKKTKEEDDIVFDSLFTLFSTFSSADDYFSNFNDKDDVTVKQKEDFYILPKRKKEKWYFKKVDDNLEVLTDIFNPKIVIRDIFLESREGNKKL